MGKAELEYVIIQRPVLQSIGCNNKALLATAYDQNDGVINISQKLAADEKRRTNKTHGTIASLMNECTFRSSATERDDVLCISQVYIDLGRGHPEDLEKALRGLVSETMANGMSSKGTEEPRKLFTEFKSAFD